MVKLLVDVLAGGSGLKAQTIANEVQIVFGMAGSYPWKQKALLELLELVLLVQLLGKRNIYRKRSRSKSTSGVSPTPTTAFYQIACNPWSWPTSAAAACCLLHCVRTKYEPADKGQPALHPSRKKLPLSLLKQHIPCSPAAAAIVARNTRVKTRGRTRNALRSHQGGHAPRQIRNRQSSSTSDLSNC
jgi:hypothetical protein